MSAHPADPSAAFERLSALVDGELDESSVAAACAAWRGDAATRAAWHQYQVIGDALRSSDLASSPAHDESFLLALRGRLAREPVVLAPQRSHSDEAERLVPAAAAATSKRNPTFGRRNWIASGAMAAGVLAVTSALLVTREPERSTVEPALAVSASSLPVFPTSADLGPASASALVPFEPAAVPVTVATFAAEPQPIAASAKVIRDARLDRYLAAHKQFAGSSALGVPSVFLRSAAADMSSR